MTDFANVLAAASVLLAVIAVLLGTWMGDIAKALETSFEGVQKEDREALRKPVRAALWWRAIPLAAGAVAIAGVFLPRGLAIAYDTATCHAPAPCVYDDVPAAFALTELFILAIAAVALWQVVKLGRLLLGSRS